MTFKFFHWWYEWGRAGEPGMEDARWMGEELGDIRGLSSPVWRRQSSSSLVRLRRFFSLLSFSTFTCRLAFSSESCLMKKKPRNEAANVLPLMCLQHSNTQVGHHYSHTCTHTRTHWDNVKSPIKTKCILLVCGRKPESVEKQESCNQSPPKVVFNQR